jgi:thiol-disulfide isomerase/thioredoxin
MGGRGPAAFFFASTMTDVIHNGRSHGHRRRALLVAGLALPLTSLASGPLVQWNDIELIDGRILTARELQASAVVAQIWASWCPFCGAQNPHVQKLYDLHKSRGLLVVAFSIDKTAQAARDYVARRGYTFPVAMATPQVDAWFGRRRTLPETYVVDRAGRVVFTHRGEMFPEDIAALSRFVAA